MSQKCGGLIEWGSPGARARLARSVGANDVTGEHDPLGASQVFARALASERGANERRGKMTMAKNSAVWLPLSLDHSKWSCSLVWEVSASIRAGPELTRPLDPEIRGNLALVVHAAAIVHDGSYGAPRGSPGTGNRALKQQDC